MSDQERENGGGEQPSLSVDRIGPHHPLLPEILESVRSIYHRDPDPIRRNLEADQGNLRAIFEGRKRVGYLLLSDCRSPLSHLGNRIDPQAALPLLEDPLLRVWTVSFLHGEPGTAPDISRLAEAA